MGVVQAISRCRSCSAEIVWAETTGGERMPLDVRPAAGGNVRLVDDNGTRRAHVVGSTIDLFDPDDDGTRFMPHFVSCPDAGSWRR